VCKILMHNVITAIVNDLFADLGFFLPIDFMFINFTNYIQDKA